MSRNKAYSEEEEEFILASTKLAKYIGCNNAEMAKMIAPILGRTTRAVEQKIGMVRRQYEFENEPKERWNREEPVYFPKKEPEIAQYSSTQMVQNEYVMEESEPFAEEDVGKIVEVEVVSIQDFGAFCRNDEGKVGLLLKGLVSSEYVTDIEDYLQIGDRFKVLIIRDRKEREKTLLNAKAIGNIIPIRNRRRM